MSFPKREGDCVLSTGYALSQYQDHLGNVFGNEGVLDELGTQTKRGIHIA